MAKRLHFVKIDTIKKIIATKHTDINRNIKDRQRFEFARNIGRAYFECAVYEFFTEYKIDKDIAYALKLLNVVKSSSFILELYSMLALDRFEEESKCKKMDEIAATDYKKSIFYCFVFYIFTDTTKDSSFIKEKLFKQYLFHYIYSVNKNTPVSLDYQKLAHEIAKHKKITLKESFKANDDSAVFKLFIDAEEFASLEGKSIKTLRKKCYKKAFYYILDEK